MGSIAVIAAIVVLVLLLLLLGVLLWAGGGKTVHETQGSGIIESIPDALEREPAVPQTLVVLSYDLAYGLGTPRRGSFPPDVATVYDRLDQLVETIAASGADIALLQEVDFGSQRTHNVDQLHYIVAALGWGYAARALTWECCFLPYPLWPLGRPIGQLRAGMGVISRYPLVQNIRQRLPQPRSLPFLSSLFRPYHTVQMVDVQCGHQTIRLLHVHLDAHDAATRQQQARELLAFVRQVETPTSVLMGAFNAALPEAAGVSTDADAARDQTMDIIITGLRGRFRIVTDNGLTSAATTPRARLEHVLTGSGLRAPEAHVIPLREPISEHLPVVVRLRWALPLMVSNGRSAHERL